MHHFQSDSQKCMLIAYQFVQESIGTTKHLSLRLLVQLVQHKSLVCAAALIRGETNHSTDLPHEPQCYNASE